MTRGLMSRDLNDCPHNRFSLLQAKHLFSDHDNNLVLSPLSTIIMLSLRASGSDSPTQDHLLVFLLRSGSDRPSQHDLLRFLSIAPLDTIFRKETLIAFNSVSCNIATTAFADGKPLGGPLLSLTNAVWVDHTLKFSPAFAAIVQDYSYKPATYRVDFRNKADDVRKEVNSWASKEVFPPNAISSRTGFIFANASCFRGAWEREFDASETEDNAFFISNRATPIQVPFMMSRRSQYMASFDGFKVLRLPYKRGRDKRKFSMCLFLPDTKDGLPALMKNIGPENKRFIERHVPYKRVRIGDFRIPKFKIKSVYEADEILKGHGLMLPFPPGGVNEMFDFDQAADGKHVVGRMFQKVFVEVNEHGTNKGGGSGDGAKIGCGDSIWGESMDFVADHPFLFVIRDDKSGLVFFIGKLIDPLTG